MASGKTGKAQEVEKKRWPLPARAGWAIAFLMLLVLGGTSDRFFFGRGLAEAIGALMLGAAMARGGVVLRRDRLLFALLLGCAALLLLQAVPLPPDVWAALSGREVVAQLDAALGVRWWRPVSLDLEAVIAAGLFLVPCVGALFAVATDGQRKDGLLLAVALAWTLAVIISLLQTILGLDLRYSQTSHQVFPSGFFFNRNHHAIFLTCAGFLAAAFAFERGWRMEVILSAVFVTGLTVLLTGSRSGTVLYLAVVLATAATVLMRNGKLRVKGMTVTAALALVMLMAALFHTLGDGPLSAVLQRDALLADRRFTIWERSLELVAYYWPVGSGIGTFAQVYAMIEPLEEVGPLFVNHAHNDWLELVIETGLPGAMLLVGLVIWLAMRTRAAWNLRANLAPTVAAALVVLWTLLAASFVEFPLRTVSLAALASLCCGLVAREGLSRNGPAPLSAEEEARKCQAASDMGEAPAR